MRISERGQAAADTVAAHNRSCSSTSRTNGCRFLGSGRREVPAASRRQRRIEREATSDAGPTLGGKQTKRTKYARQGRESPCSRPSRVVFSPGQQLFTVTPLPSSRRASALVKRTAVARAAVERDEATAPKGLVDVKSSGSVSVFTRRCASEATLTTRPWL